MAVFMDSGQASVMREGAAVALQALLQAICEDPAELLTAEIRLFTNDQNASCEQVDGDYTEADFTGYAAVPVGGVNPCAGILQIGLDEDGVPTIYLDQQTFTVGAGPVTPNTVYGWYIVVEGSGLVDPALLAVRRFANGPFSMADTGDQLKVSGQMKLDCNIVPLVVPES